MLYSFCESAWAGGRSRWHIRPLTEKGKLLGGGADTLALCGAKVAWDLKSGPEGFNLNEVCCPECARRYLGGK